MAARGRFGRSDTGTSNLSALIRQLVSQQQAAEEKALMDAFYGGLQYNGSVPTMADVKDFYMKYLDLTGTESGTENWNIVQQKIESANNYEIKVTYSDLKSTFESTNGSNYQQLMEFLKGQAQESTDPQDSNIYDQSVSVFTQNYIQYRGEDLLNGLIDVASYRQISQEALATISPSDPAYNTTLITSYKYEWSSEKTKMDNRFVAGKIGAGSYAKWANEFKASLLAAGISKSSSLYTEIDAAIARANGSSGGGGTGGVAATRLAKTYGDLSSIWGVIKKQFGGTSGVYYMGQTESQANILKDISQNPDWVQSYGDIIDARPGIIPSELQALGITDSASLLSYFQNLLNDGASEAGIVAAAGGSRSDLNEWVGANYAAGGITGFSMVKYADTQWQTERANAANDDQRITWLDNEYKKYLQGQDSHFGKLPGSTQFTSEQGVWLQNQLDALNGVYTPGSQTVSGYGESGSTQDNIDKELGTVGLSAQNALSLSTGAKVNVWDPNVLRPDGQKGAFVVEDPRQVGTSNGQYQYVYASKRPDGSIVTQIRVVFGKQVYDQNQQLKTDIYSYVLPDGSTVFSDSRGQQYNSDNFGAAGDGSYVISTGQNQGNSLGTVPRFDYSGLWKTTEFDSSGDSFLERKAMADKMNANDLRVASELASNVMPGLDAEAAANVANDIATVQSDANAIEADAIRRMNRDTTDPSTRIQLAELDGRIGNNGKNYADFLRRDAKFYTEVAPDVWQVKPEYAQAGTSGIQKMLGDVNLFAAQNPLLSPLAAIPAIPLMAGTLIEGLFAQTPNQPLDFRTEEQKNASNAAGAAAAAPQIQSIQNTGYNTAGVPGSDNPFFRNLSATAPKQSTSLYLSTQANVPTVAAPTVPKASSPSFTPTMIPLSSIALKGVAGDSLLERRDTLLRNATTKTPVSNSTLYAGQGGGGF
jgi:hypothetical protein